MSAPVLHRVTMRYMAKGTTRIDPGVRTALDTIAAGAERHRSAYLWQTEHIRQGLREADAGQFASSARVKKTISRLLRK